MADLPTVERLYQNHHLDSSRWDAFRPRAGDIVVTTSYKAGTTWTQTILAALIHGPEVDVSTVLEESPWVDARFTGTTKDELAAQLEDMPDPRSLKSHLPLDGLPYYPEARYLIVARDPRDVFMSLMNHYGNYTDAAYAQLNTKDIVGEPFPRFADDPKVLWRKWITQGWFPWESEGYPFWSNMHHTQSYWDFNHLPNFLFLHYNDMLLAPELAVEKIAAFCGFDVTSETIDAVAAATKLDVVRARSGTSGLDVFFRGGADSFFYKGTNGRWRELLNEEDLALYETAKQRVLSADCARWLEEGELT